MRKTLQQDNKPLLVKDVLKNIISPVKEEFIQPEEFFNENELLGLRIHIVKAGGKDAIEIRKTFTFCEQNKEFIEKMIIASMRGEPITAHISIAFADKLKAAQRLKEIGIDVSTTLYSR